MPYSDLSDAWYDLDPRYEKPTPPPEPEQPIYDWYNKNISPIGSQFSEYLKRSGEALARIPQDISKNVAIPFLEQREQAHATDWSNQPFIGVGEKGELTGRLPALAGYVAPYLLGAAPGGSATLPAGVKLPGGKYGYPEGLEGGYHGTHAVFPPEPENLLGKFMNEKINTGEGAQAYGYGHYVGAKKGTGVSYMPDSTPVMHLEGEPWNPYDLPLPYIGRTTHVPYHEEVAYDLLRDTPKIMTPNGHMPDFDAVIADLKDSMARSQDRYDRAQVQIERDKWKGFDDTSEMATARREHELISDDRATIDWIVRNRDKITMETPGSLYHVEMKPPEESLMHWDRMIADQPQAVQDKLRQVAEKHLGVGEGGNKRPWNESFTDMTGGEFYKSFRDDTDLLDKYPGMTGHGQALSEAMREAGIPGIRFADQQSRPIQAAKSEIDRINTKIEGLQKALDENLNPQSLNKEAQAAVDRGEIDLSRVHQIVSEEIANERLNLAIPEKQIRDSRTLEYDGKPIFTPDAVRWNSQGDIVKQRALGALLDAKDVDIAINRIKAVMNEADRQGVQSYRAGLPGHARSENRGINQHAIEWLEKNRDKINLKDRDITHNYVIFDPKDLNIIHREKNLREPGVW